MALLRRGRFALLLVVLLLARPAFAQDFVPLADVAAKTPSGKVLFFPLADRFEEASPYALLPAEGRRIVWTPESAELPGAAVAVAAVRAVGTPPAQPEAARYLLPVLDGATAELRFAARRLDGGRLVPFEGTPEPGRDVVPLLAGPRLDATPSETPLTRVLEAPVEVDVSVLADVQPSVLVRKATPSRVVFGVQVGDRYLPLIDETGVAVTAKHEGRAGLAVAVADDFEPPSTTTTEAENRLSSKDDDSDSNRVLVLRVLVLGGILAMLATWRRRRRSSAR